MKPFFMILLSALMFACFACSSSPEKTDIESPQGAIPEDEAARAPIMAPFTITIEASKLEENTLVTIRIHYVDEIRSQTTLRVKFLNDTAALPNVVPYRLEGNDGKLLRSPSMWEETLPPAAAGTDVARQVLLSGNIPSIEVNLGLYEEGFSFEMTEVWPIVPMAHRVNDPNMALENPVEIDGVQVNQSVSVKPKRHQNSD